MGRGKSVKSLALIEASRAILEEIQPATVRAICYKLFVLEIIDDMSKANTNRVSTHLTWAREQEEIPWDWIVDETREAERPGTWQDPGAFIDAVERSYRRDHWALQPRRIEIWSEKGTVRGTLAPVLREYGVTFRVMHGYASATAVHEIAGEHAADPRPLLAFYVGDWDPSGLHMSEVDLPGRLAQYRLVRREEVREFFRRVAEGVAVGTALERALATPPERGLELRRLALTAEDVRDPALPGFAAATKRGDPRWRWFIRRYGERCWELDALNPVRLRDRVAAAIEAEIDPGAWERCARAEAAEQESLATVLTGWRAAMSGQASE